MNWTFGVDLGGTKINICMVNSGGKIHGQEIIPTRVKEGPRAIISDVISVIKKMRSQNHNGKFLGIGIGMAGQIDKNTGSVYFAPNLGWKDFHLQAEVSKALQLPVFVINDVRAAMWGEWLYGEGRGCNDLLGIFIGTGIGGGIVSGGNMLIGDTNTAGEIGHMTIDLHGPVCTCGNRGCFEALAAGWAIGRRTREVVSGDISHGYRLLELAGGKLEDITAKHLFEAYYQGIPIAIKVMEEVKEALVAGVAGLVNAFNPARVILGGGVLVRNPELIEFIRQGVATRALKITTTRLEILEAQLENDANVIGAAVFARRSALK